MIRIPFGISSIDKFDSAIKDQFLPKSFWLLFQNIESFNLKQFEKLGPKLVVPRLQ